MRENDLPQPMAWVNLGVMKHNAYNSHYHKFSQAHVVDSITVMRENDLPQPMAWVNLRYIKTTTITLTQPLDVLLIVSCIALCTAQQLLLRNRVVEIARSVACV